MKAISDSNETDNLINLAVNLEQLSYNFETISEGHSK